MLIKMRTFGMQILLTHVVKQESKPRLANHICLSTNFMKISVRSNSSNTTTHVVNSPHKSIHIPSMTLPELIWSRTDRHPNHIAIECGLTGRKYSYSQLQKLSHRMAVSLLKAGLRPGQTVIIFSPNCIEHPVLYLGAMEAGLSVTPINSVYTADEICFQLKDSQAACVISSPQLLDTVISAINKFKETKKNGVDVKIIALDVGQELNKELPPGVGRFSDLISDHVDEKSLDSLRSCNVRPKNVAVCPYSSGTTGLPKGVQLKHVNLVSSILQLSSPEVDIQSDATDTYQEIIPCVLPFYHIYGFIAVLMKSLFSGNKMVVLPKFEGHSYIQLLLNHKCTLLYVVPPLVSFLGTNPAVKKELFEHVKYIMCGAAPLRKNDLDRFLQKLHKGSKFNFLQAYGITEALAVTHPRTDCTVLNTVGVPLSNTKLKVVHTTTGESLGPYQDGELCVKGPQVMKGYFNNSTSTVCAKDNDGWFRTGDIGHYDKDSNFFIVDRLKELIKVKGFQVAPAELEDLLRTHPAVSDVGVVGVPHEKSGEVPIAYVVKSPNHATFVTDLQEFVAASVAPYKQLHDIVFVDQIPKSPTGKILRREIKKQYVSKTRTL